MKTYFSSKVIFIHEKDLSNIGLFSFYFISLLFFDKKYRVPQVPQVPQVLQVPQVPRVPQVPQVPRTADS